MVDFLILSSDLRLM